MVEHDLSVLDYLSDFICCLYGVPGAYGVVTMPFSVREGLIIFVTIFTLFNFFHQVSMFSLMGLFQQKTFALEKLVLFLK